MVKLPPPNLQGNYYGSCVVCLRGTDTGLGLTGPAEFVVAGMRVLGIPTDDAEHLLAQETGMPVGRVPDGDMTMIFRVCSACAKAARPACPDVGLLPTVPNYGYGGPGQTFRTAD